MDMYKDMNKVVYTYLMTPRHERRGREIRVQLCLHPNLLSIIEVVVVVKVAVVKMDENRRKKLIYIITHLSRSSLRRRRLVSLILYYVGRNRRRLQEQRNFLAQACITMRHNLTTILSYFSTREPVNRRFWALPRPQHWFDVMLERRDLDSEWPKHFRLNRNTFMKIVEIVRPYMTTQSTNYRPATAVEKKVAAALWRLATGNAYRCIGVTLGIGTACAQLYTVQFCEVIYDKRTEYIKFPPNLASVILEFAKKTKIPNVVGAIDGSHILIKEPGEDQESYCNRNKRHSILLQGVVGPNLMFFDAFAGVPGSVHDSRVLRLSRFGKQMNEKQILQDPEFVIEEGIAIKPIILGDSAYKIKPWLFPPYTRLSNMSEDRKKFNYEHCKGREVVERGYGHLKGRWQILLNESTENLERVHITVMVCIVLHNICILYDDDTEIDEPFDDDSGSDDSDDDEQTEMDVDDEITGELLRDIITDNLDNL